MELHRGEIYFLKFPYTLDDRYQSRRTTPPFRAGDIRRMLTY